MGYGNQVELIQLQDEKTRNKLKLNLKLYSFDITLETLEALLTQTETLLEYNNSLTGYSREEVSLIAVKKIFENTRGTLKIVVFSNGKFCCFNRDAKPNSMPMISVPYDYKGPSIFENIREGMYVAFYIEGWQKTLRMATLTDCKTRKEAEQWMELYTDCLKMRDNFNAFEEMNNYKNIDAKGIITIADLEGWKAKYQDIVKEIQQLESHEVQLKEQALDKRLTITKQVLTIDALDDHKYTLTLPTGQQWKKEDWIECVYRHRYNWKANHQQDVKQNTLFNRILQSMMTQKIEWFKIAVDGKPEVKVAVKTIINKKNQEVTLTYLNDKRIANDDIYQCLYKYFIQGQTFENPAELPEDLDEAEKQKILNARKERDNSIITSGITGYINDLEGETPIKIGFEKIGVNWYLTIGEKKFPLKGGVETIKSLERVLKGTAQGYSARHSTQELYERLTKVLDSDTAIEIITEAKTMGKLLKALEVKGQNP